MGKIFISHDFKDATKFEELTKILTDRGVAFFQPSKMLIGKSLANQLREAIEECDSCIFVATHNSVKSNWCAAELGAFWGSGKDVLVY